MSFFTCRRYWWRGWRLYSYNRHWKLFRWIHLDTAIDGFPVFPPPGRLYFGPANRGAAVNFHDSVWLFFGQSDAKRIHDSGDDEARWLHCKIDVRYSVYSALRSFKKLEAHRFAALNCHVANMYGVAFHELFPVGIEVIADHRAQNHIGHDVF